MGVDGFQMYGNIIFRNKHFATLWAGVLWRSVKPSLITVDAFLYAWLNHLYVYTFYHINGRKRLEGFQNGMQLCAFLNWSFLKNCFDNVGM